VSAARRPRRVLALTAAAGALVLASTGGAVAGSMITGKQIKDGTVTSADIANRTITAKDLGAATRSALAGADGTDGLDGLPGPPGADGLDGLDGVSGYEVVQSFGTATPPGVETVNQAVCPVGKVAVGGGSGWGGPSDPGNVITTSLPFKALRDGSGAVVGSSFPDPDVDMWLATGYHASAGNQVLLVFVVCVTAG
jgi:hypothetical protein